ncbi:hypothetical protein BTO20_09600 [Mycobacterium dioxanotrophicus]|uniref:Uncharacterized protein n=1 Tax=Mycobacterium dioxanotrophicus TaxID=482462 RepID=A0A1Y0C0X3_9MYCO|nr:hypothetical protein [Mycobacterium dioxanotrophicus]ART68808.1 hypothetical protein BTO20_09600 [Mycobacterium dioxanotrophicus]
MGFYDCRCMLTGVSVDFVGATAVILRCTPAGYEPVALGVSGDYSGYGMLWGLTEDRNTQLVYEYFSRLSRSGRFTARMHPLEDPVEFTDELDLEQVLGAIESSWSLSPPYDGEDLEVLPLVVLDGANLVFALIAQPIWDAIAAAGPAEASLQAAFGDATVPQEIYGGHLSEVEPQLRQFAAVNAFVRAHGLRWAPPADPAQRYPTEMGAQRDDDENAEFIAQARRDYHDSPALLAGLDAYEKRL